MRKRNLLLATLLVSVAFGLGSTNKAMAETDVTINGTGTGGDDTWATATATTSYLRAVNPSGDNGDNYTHWVGDLLDDTLTMYAGSELTTEGLTQNAYLYANGGTINVTSGQLDAYGDSYIRQAVALTVASGATLKMNSASANVVLSSNDQLNGYLNAQNGTLTIADGSHNIKSGSTIKNAVALTVNSDATLGVMGSNVTIGANDTISGKLNVSSEGVLNINDSINVGSLTNSSTVTGEGLSLTLNKSGATSVNTGTINVGTVNVDQNHTLETSGSIVATYINIESNAALKLTDGTVTGDVTNSGLFTFAGGTLNGNYTQSATGKSVFNSDTTFNAGSQISGGEMELVASDVVFNNGVDNNAKILMTIDDGSSLSIIGLEADHDTTLTLNEDSNLAYGSLNVGDGTYYNELNVTANSQIAQAVLVDLKANAAINLSGSTSSLAMDTADNWRGDINQSAGTLNILGTLDENNKSGKLVTTADTTGIIIIGNGTDVAGTLELNNADDLITQAARVTINNNGKLDITRGTVTLDNTTGSADTWEGKIALGGSGVLNMKNRIDVDTTDAIKTYNQNGGTLNMDEATLNLGTSQSRIIDGVVNMKNASKLILNNGSTQNMAQVVTQDNTMNILSLLGGVNGNPSLQLVGSSEIAKATVVTISEGTTLQISGTTTALDPEDGNDTFFGVNLNGDGSADTWAGNVIVANGVLNISGDLTKTGTLTQTVNTGTTNIINAFALADGDTITKGAFNIGDGNTTTTLGVSGTAVIDKEAVVTIANNATMTVNAESGAGYVTLNGAETAGSAKDTWAGTVINDGSTNLTLDGFTGVGHAKTGIFIQESETAVTTITNGFDINNENDLISAGTLNVNSGNLNMSDGEISGGTINVTGTEQNPSSMTLSGGEISGGTVTIADDLTMTGGTISNGTINVTDELAMSGGTISDGDINVTGNMSVSGGSVAADADLDIDGDLIISDTGTVNYGGEDDSVAGTITQTGGTLNIVDDTDDTVNITGGTLNIQDDNTLTVGEGSSIISGVNGEVTNAVVNIAGDATLLIDGGSVTLNGLDGQGGLTSVDWDGTVQLDSGSLTLAYIFDQSRVDDPNDPDSYNKTGTLIANGGTLTIDNTNVLLGEDDLIAEAVDLHLTGNLIVEDDAVVTVDNGDSWDSGEISLDDDGNLTLIGVTTGENTNINAEGGNLTLQNGVDENSNPVGVTLNNTYDNIAYGAIVTMNGDLTINAGHVQLNGVSTTDTVDDSDTLTSGTITLGGGTLDLMGIETENVNLVATTGSLNIDPSDTATSLVNTADSIAEAVVVNIKEGATLTIDNNGTNNWVVLNGLGTGTTNHDTLAGTLNLVNGHLEIKDSDATTGDTVGTYTQTGGVMTLTDSALTLADASSFIDGANATVHINGTENGVGSDLTFDNGRISTPDSNDINQAIIVSDANAGNSLTVGGTNGAELTLLSGSDINGNTAVTVTANGILNASGDSIKGGNPAVVLTNNGEFNLTHDILNPGTEEEELVPGTIARIVNGTGTTNLTGTTLSTAGSTITQANINVGDDTTATTFTMGADVTANTMLTVNNNATVENAGSTITAEQLTVDAQGVITGLADEEQNLSYGDLVVNNGGSNAGNITQDDVTFVAGEFLNTGTLTANGTFKNDATIADNVYDEDAGTAPSGVLNINGGGVSNGAITQSIINVTGPTSGDDVTPFVNNNIMTATDEFNNSGVTNNNNQILVQNDDHDAALTNSGIINANPGSEIHADTLANHVVTPGENPEDDPVITEGTINMTNATVAVYYQSDDIQGVINVKENAAGADNSELAIASADASNPAAFVGDLNVGGYDEDGNPLPTAELDFTSGVIGEAADVAIASGSVLKLDSSISILNDDESPVDPQTPTLTLNGANDDYAADDFSGDLVNQNGDVTLKDMTVYTGDDSTAEGGQNPHYEQNGGSLSLENTEMTMENSSNIDGGDMTVDAGSVFNSESGAFTVEDLANAGLINGINGTYEDYTATDYLYAGDNATGEQGDYNIDIYGRSNNNSSNDTFGDDGATITAANGQHGILNIADWTLNGDIYGFDAPIDRNIDLGQVFKGDPDNTVEFTATNKQVLTPIGWYGLTPTGAGNYSFDLKRYNPAVFRGQVTKIAQYQNQLAIDDMLFNHTMLDQGFKGNDYIASHPNRYASANDLFAPYQYSRKDGGLWVKMYGTFEKLNMNHGLNVGNNAYGTIIGADFGLKDLSHGWQFMPTAYIAYNGAHQYWRGNSAYQNGGQLGVMGTWYKNDFMIGALAFGGVYGNDMNTPRGSDDTFNYFAGGAVKAAYNWRFAKDWALQPNFLVAYSFFGQENWHTDFGQMGMMSGMLNGVNVAPGLNLIWEKETFSTYATIQYMYNVNQAVGGRAGNVGLPHVHMDRGYIQYGLGINKTFTDRFSGYFQTVLRNVGRTGVGLQLGFNWQLGKGGSNSNMRGYTPELKKTAIKLNGNRY